MLHVRDQMHIHGKVYSSGRPGNFKWRIIITLAVARAHVKQGPKRLSVWFTESMCRCSTLARTGLPINVLVKRFDTQYNQLCPTLARPALRAGATLLVLRKHLVLPYSLAGNARACRHSTGGA